MTESPLVSVIMPAYNASPYILEALDSIKSQTYPHWELLVCDDASTDNTHELIVKYSAFEPRVKVFKNTSNLRLLKTRNRLIAEAKGQLITFQDADDYSDRERLDKMVSEFLRNPRLGLLSSQVGYVSTKGRLLRISNKPTNYLDALQLMRQTNALGGSVMMIRRDALEFVGGKFREYFDGQSYQDYDLSMLIAEKHEAYALKEVLYYYRQHASSTSKIVDANRILAKEVVIHLAKQRRESGSDDVMTGGIARLDEYFEALRQPYKKDPSLVYREYAANFMFNRLYRKALNTAMMAVRTEPARFINWRTLQYCLRKSLTALFP